MPDRSICHGYVAQLAKSPRTSDKSVRPTNGAFPNSPGMLVPSGTNQGIEPRSLDSLSRLSRQLLARPFGDFAICGAKGIPHIFYSPLQNADTVLVGLAPLGKVRVHRAPFGNLARKKSPLAARAQQVNTAQNTSCRSNVVGLVRRRTLCSRRWISSNFSRLTSLAYVFLIALFSVRKERSWTRSKPCSVRSGLEIS